MHGHGLGAVLGQVHRVQAVLTTQGMGGEPVAGAYRVDGPGIPRHHTVEQAHVARVRDEVDEILTRDRVVHRKGPATGSSAPAGATGDPCTASPSCQKS